MINLVPSNLNKFIERLGGGSVEVAGRGGDFEEPTSSARANDENCIL